MKAKFTIIIAATFATAVHAGSVTSVSQSRALAMGNTGVAVGDVTTAAMYNPALLSSSKVKHSFALSFPTFSIGVADPDHFVDSIDDFQDKNSIDSLTDSIDSANFMVPGSFTRVADNADAVSGELASISGREISVNGGLVGSFAIPGQNFGFAMTASVSSLVGGVVNYTDDNSLSNLSQDLRNYDNCLAANITLLGSCIPSDQDWNYIDPLTGDVLFNTDEDLTSSVSVHGLLLAEIGFSMSTSFKVKGIPVAVGVTPKFVHAVVFNYMHNVETADIGDIDVDDYTSETSDFNLDVGALVEVNKYWTVGLAVKNVFAKEYKAERFSVETGYVVNIEPSVRLGVAYEQDWLTLAMDAELNKTELVYGRDQQLISLGAELNAWDVAQVRLGYQHDIGEGLDMYSAGVGFSPFGLHLDVAAAANEQQAVLSMQLGFKW
jgi:hypothetical protein